MSISTFNELKEACIKKNKTIWELTQEEEAVQSDITVEDVRLSLIHI